MSRSKTPPEDPEMARIRKEQQELQLRAKVCADLPRQLAAEIRERERTMPPLQELADRETLIRHNEIISRGQISNVHRDQNRSILLLLMLITATAALIWWGLRIMQGS
jgi:hypothetical protein